MYTATWSVVLLLACSICGLSTAARTVDTHLDATDLERLQKVFVEGIASDELQSIYYSSLNTEVKGTEALCKKLLKLHAETKLKDYEKDYYLIGSRKQARCADKLPETLLSQIYAAFKKDAVNAQEVYYRVATHNLLGVQIDEATKAKIAKNLKDILKKDDSPSSLGYAFNAAALLGTPAAFVADRLEDAIVQADEVEGKMLQFEGGLSITALVINGVFGVSKTFKKPTTLTAEQAAKFGTYFLSRRSVRSAKGAHVLIESLKALNAAEAKLAPICMQIIGNGQLEAATPTLSIKVVDLFGKALSPPPKSIYGKVSVQKANTVLAEKVQFVTKSSDKTTFAADLSTYKPTRGIYVVDINADDSFTQTLEFKVVSKVKVHSLEVGVGDSDAGNTLKKHTVAYPNTLSSKLEADGTQKLIMKFVLVDEGTTKVITVHQAFLRLYNTATKEEIFFIAEQDTSKAYKIDLDLGARSADFGYKSGLYQLDLIVGDFLISNSFKWHVANLQLKFAQEPKETKKQTQRAPLPEIRHKFREPEKRPPRVVSDLFTALCAAPLLLLFVMWGKLGVNVSNFSFAPSSIGFHLGFGSILTLFGVFWWQLNMFQTLRLLIPLSIFTFLCGNRLLRRLYAQRVAKDTKSS